MSFSCPFFQSQRFGKLCFVSTNICKDVYMRYSRCFYTTMKSTFHDHGTLKAKLIFYYDCFAFAYAMKILVYFVCRSNADFTLNSYDPIANLMHRHSTKASVILVAMLLFYDFFVLVMSHSFYSMPVDKPIWQWYYDLIVGVQDLKEKNTIVDNEERKRIVESKIQGRNRWPWSGAVAALSVWLHQDYVDKEKLYSESFILAEASDRLKLKLLLGLQLVNSVCFQSQVLIALLSVAFFSANFTFILGSFPQFPYSLFVLHDTFLVYYQLYRLVQGAFFYTPVSIFAAAIYSDYSKASFSKVQQMIQKFLQKNSRESPLLPALPTRHFGSAIESTLRRHHQVTYLTMAGNQQVFGRIIVCFLLANIPLNIYAISQLILVQQSTMGAAIFLLIIFYQFLAAFIVFYPSAWGSVRLHAPSKMMPLMVGLMGSPKWLQLKLKVDELFHKLTWGPKIASQVGPIKQITYQTAFDIFLLYTVYLMMAFSSFSQQATTKQ